MNNKTLADFSCKLCPLKRDCEELCPPMSWIVMQEESPQREKPKAIDNRIPAKFPEAPSTSEIIFKMFFFERKSQQEVADILNVSQPYVSKEVQKQMKLIAENLRKRMK